MSSPRIAVTGLGLLSAAGAGSEAFSRAIQTGVTFDRPAPELEAPEHQARVAARIPAELRPDPSGDEDPAFGLAEAAIAEALKQAGLDGLPKQAALLVGSSLGGAIAAQRAHRSWLEGEVPRESDLVQAKLHSLGDSLGAHLGLEGPRLTLSNACVSSTNALGIAFDWLRDQEAEVAIVGGVDTLHSFNFCGFSTLWALSSEKCRPFDPRRSGMLLGEAAAFLVLETEEHLRRRSGKALAEIRGYGSSGDAVHITAPDREGGGVYRAITEALDEAAWEAKDVDFISAHGTGTLYLDGMEAAAFQRVFGDSTRDIPVASLRPVTGHCLGSAGAVDSIACVLAIQEDFVPPTPNHDELDPALPALLKILREVQPQKVRAAINTSSGFAGANAALLFTPWDEA